MPFVREAAYQTKMKALLLSKLKPRKQHHFAESMDDQDDSDAEAEDQLCESQFPFSKFLQDILDSGYESEEDSYDGILESTTNQDCRQASGSWTNKQFECIQKVNGASFSPGASFSQDSIEFIDKSL